MSSLAGLALAAANLPKAALAASEEKTGAGAGAGWKEGDDLLLRLQEDLRRALTKPLEARKWTMVIDLRKCIGCFACTIACKSENVLPPSVVYRRVLDLEAGKYPHPRRDFVPVLCNHCEDAPCVIACPVKATTKRQDGIVDMEYEKCIGCRACLNACPYGSRTSDFGQFYTDQTPHLEEYERRPAYEYKKEWPRRRGRSPMGNARKCHFCIHRIERGILPACVATCIGKATYFGDKEDSQSLVWELIHSQKVMRLKDSLNTNPRVYYISEGISYGDLF
jgi:molybdopterin-containing oxidoreductase family iron-sulfur binding subunit